MNEQDLSCEEVIERLFTFLDHELDSRSSADIERHLQRCRDCFTRAEFERKLRAKVAGTGTAKAPARLHDRVRSLIKRY